MKRLHEVSRDDVLITPRQDRQLMDIGVAFVDEIPYTATGKVQKFALRERLKGYHFPATAAAARPRTMPARPGK